MEPTPTTSASVALARKTLRQHGISDFDSLSSLSVIEPGSDQIHKIEREDWPSDDAFARELNAMLHPHRRATLAQAEFLRA